MELPNFPIQRREPPPEIFRRGNKVTLLTNGEQAFPAMLQAIEEAEEQILLEMYWFSSDKVGQRFAAALTAAAERGVEVALIFDSLGSRGHDPALFTQLCARGAQVIEFRPLSIWHNRFRVQRLTSRDHRKVLLIDGRLGFVGGINLGCEWAPVSEGGGGWRDDMFQVEGPAVFDALDCFERVWARQGGGPLRDLRDQATPVGDQKARVLGQAGFRDRREITRAYLHHLRQAKRNIWISNAYFVPEPAVVRALRDAARRGVDVRILLPAKSDVEIVRHASRAVWGRLLRHGVRIFKWQPSMMHSKTAVIDGRWCTTGTLNLDYRSVRANLEINISVRDENFASEVEAAFETDLSCAREVQPMEFRWRSLGDRLLEWLAYRFRLFL